MLEEKITEFEDTWNSIVFEGVLMMYTLQTDYFIQETKEFTIWIKTHLKSYFYSVFFSISVWYYLFWVASIVSVKDRNWLRPPTLMKYLFSSSPQGLDWVFAAIDLVFLFCNFENFHI